MRPVGQWEEFTVSNGIQEVYGPVCRSRNAGNPQVPESSQIAGRFPVKIQLSRNFFTGYGVYCIIPSIAGTVTRRRWLRVKRRLADARFLYRPKEPTMLRSPYLQTGLMFAVICGTALTVSAANKRGNSAGSSAPTSPQIAAEVDRLILSDLQKNGIKPVDRCNDADFMRRVTLDITGQLPSPRDVTIFALDPEPNKRSILVEQLLRSPEYGKNWARYWRDVIYMPATENRARIAQSEFEVWMADRLNSGKGWDQTVTAMLTATGDVQEHPETALLIAQGAQAPEIAAEASRIFLGIQMQCANCHDHPSDIWKRDQFHELAAYFPRISIRQMQQPISFEIASVNTDRGRGDFMRENPERFISMNDRNGDGKLTKEEMKSRAPGGIPTQLLDRIFDLGDSNKDGALNLAELKALPMPDQARRGSTEHYMPDLNDPSSKGKQIEPKFFVDGSTPGHGLSDQDRRAAVAKAFTSPDNPWFARAIVNRMWCEFLGEGFYMPVDDLGPTRTARFPEAIDALASGFIANHYDIKWLVRSIANSQTYQRKVAAKSVAEDALPFAAVTPTRLRGDVVFNALMQVLGIDEENAGGPRGAMMMAGPRAYQRTPRFQFDVLFGIDPSVPKDDITGNVPQSLFLMNTNSFRTALSGTNTNTRLGKILRDNRDDRDALSEIYLLVLSREPSKHEVEICEGYLKDVGQRAEAFEDLMWSLLNSSEFLSKR